MTPAGTADSQDYTLSMHPVDIAADGESATVDLTVRENEEVNPETLVLDAEVAGEAAKGSETRTSPGILSVAIEDTTPRLVRAKSEEDIYAALMAAKDAVMGDHGLNPGEDFELMGADLFDAAADVTISYTAESDSESTASVSVVDGTIAVMPTSEGTAHVTVTATVTPTASGVEIIEQTEANVARILFPVEVTLEPPAFSMSADDTDIVEGMSGGLTVSASRPVSTDTDVMIVRDGTSSAGADDFLNRYHERHTDLMDVFSGHQLRSAAPLEELSRFLGLPGKQGMRGADVEGRYFAGEIDAIRNYCEGDALLIWLIHLRFDRLRGRLDDAQLAHELALVREAVRDRDHLQAFADAGEPE